MKKSVLLMVLISGSVFAVGDDIAISEVYEGNGGNVKYVELFNLTNASIDLAAGGWKLVKYANAGGAGTGTDIPLVGTIAAKDFFVVGNNDAANGVESVFPVGTLDQGTTSINHNGNDEYELHNAGGLVDTFAGDHIGDTNNFSVNVVAFRVMSTYPNNGNWVALRRGGPITSPSGYWATVAITASNANALSVATPGTAGGAGGVELPVELMHYSVE